MTKEKFKSLKVLLFSFFFSLESDIILYHFKSFQNSSHIFQTIYFPDTKIDLSLICIFYMQNRQQSIFC